MDYLLPFGQAHGDQAWRCGPKAARLSQLSAAGFAVPPGMALTSDALVHFLRYNGSAQAAAQIMDEIDARSAADLGEWPARADCRGGDAR